MSLCLRVTLSVVLDHGRTCVGKSVPLIQDPHRRGNEMQDTPY